MMEIIKLFQSIYKTILIIFVSAILVCCSDPQQNNTDKLPLVQSELSISAPGIVPVFDNNQTDTFLVLNNYSNQTITNIDYKIVSTGADHLDNMSTLQGNNGCKVLLPHQSCQINYRTPLLYFDKSAGADLFVVQYKIADKTKSTSAPLRYQAVYASNNQDVNSVNSTGSPEVMSGYNGQQSAMVYFYVSGNKPITIDDVTINLHSFKISNRNFSTGNVIPQGTVLSYEVTAISPVNAISENSQNTAVATMNFAYSTEQEKYNLPIKIANVSANTLNKGYVVMSSIPVINSSYGNNPQSNFTIFNVGTAPISGTLSSSNANVSLSTLSFSNLGVGASQTITASAPNESGYFGSSTITMSATGSNSFAENVTVIGGPTLVALVMPQNTTFQENAATPVTIQLVNPSSSAGVIKITSLPTFTNGGRTTLNIALAAGNTCTIGAVIPPGSSCSYVLTLTDTGATTFGSQFFVTSSVGYSTSQTGYTDSNITKAIMSTTVYMNSAYIVAVPSGFNLNFVGNNSDSESYVVTFWNDTTSNPNSTVTPYNGTVSNIHLESNLVSYVNLSTTGLSTPCNLSSQVLTPGQSCSVVVVAGPYNSPSVINSVSSQIAYNYNNNVQTGTQTGYVPFTYSVGPGVLNMLISVVTPQNNISGGAGSSANPFVFSGHANGAQQSITVYYQNVSGVSVRFMSPAFQNGYGNDTNYWTVNDNCSGQLLTNGNACTVVYQQNYYNYLTTSLNNICASTTTSMNITSPTFLVHTESGLVVYTESNLVYPAAQGGTNTLYVTESNLWVNNNMVAIYTGNGTYPGTSNYNLQVTANLSNYASYNVSNTIGSIGFIGTNFTQLGFSPYISSQLSSASCTTNYLPPSSGPIWNQSCNQGAASAMNNGVPYMGEAYTFSEQTGTNSMVFYSNPSVIINDIASFGNQAYCSNATNTQINLN